MTYELPRLPWPHDSLGSLMSTETVALHYGKHHAGYVEKLNRAIAGTRYEALDLVHTIQESARGRSPVDLEVFHDAAQHFNHTFYWNGLSPDGGGPPPRPVEDALRRAFGSVDAFRERFTRAAVEHFGSGWAWLERDAERVLSDGTRCGRSDRPRCAHPGL